MPRQMKLLHLLLLGLIVSTAFAPLARANDDVEDEVDTDTDTEAEATDYATADAGADDAGDEPTGPPPESQPVVLFPGFETKEFPAESLITAIIGYKNLNEQAIFIEGVSGSLRNPGDHSEILGNFTAQAVRRPLKSGEETSLVYYFKSSPAFAGNELTLVLDVHFKNEDEAYFGHQVHNSTVKVTASVQPVDWLQLLPLALLVIALALFGEWISGGYKGPVVGQKWYLTAFKVSCHYCSLPAKWAVKEIWAGKKAPAPVAKKAAAAPTETGTKAAAADNEWLDNMIKTPKSAKSPKAAKQA